jgi:hypothetical protein
MIPSPQYQAKIANAWLLLIFYGRPPGEVNVAGFFLTEGGIIVHTALEYVVNGPKTLIF